MAATTNTMALCAVNSYPTSCSVTTNLSPIAPITIIPATDAIARLAVTQEQSEWNSIFIVISGNNIVVTMPTETITISQVSLVILSAKVRTGGTQTVTITEPSLPARLSAKIRALTTETVVISEPAPPVRVRGRVRAPSTETVTIAAGTLTRLAAKIRPIATQTVTISEVSLVRLAAKIRALATQTTTVSEPSPPARLAAKIRALPTETVTIATGTLARLAAKIRALAAQTVSIGEAVDRLSGHAGNNITKALPTETVTISAGTLARLKSILRTNTETVSISESVARMKAAQRALATQTVAISESIPAKIKGKVKALPTETLTLFEDLVRRTTKIRILSTETVAISEQSLNRASGKFRAMALQTVSISEAIAQLVGHNLNVVRALPTETVTISEAAINRLAKKIRALSTEPVSISETLAKSRGKIRVLTTQTVAISEQSLARKVQKVRTIAEAIINIIEQELKVYKNGIFLVPTQRTNKGGITVKLKQPKLKQILYPVYSPAEFERIERRRRLRQYPPLIVIPAFKYNINKTVAPFVITNRVKNEVIVKFAISNKSVEAAKPNLVFTGKALPITILPKQESKHVNKARCAHVMNQQAIERYGKKLNKVSKLMTLWSIFSSLHQS